MKNNNALIDGERQVTTKVSEFAKSYKIQFMYKRADFSF